MVTVVKRVWAAPPLPPPQRATWIKAAGSTDLHSDQSGLVRRDKGPSVSDTDVGHGREETSPELARATQSRVRARRPSGKVKAEGRLEEASWKKMLIARILKIERQVRRS